MIRVASVPADHPYVRHIGVPGDGVARLPDQRLPGQRGWWPPRMLDPSWVVEHADAFDVFHVQFGFDGRHPDQLRELCGLLAELGKPLVYTVHDLRNPNHEAHALHAEQLAVLVEHADALLTLTEAAAEAIARELGRLALVVPHPHVVPLDLLAEYERGPREAGRPPLVGLHLKSLRANMVGVPILEALAFEETPAGFALRVDVHEEIWDHQAPGFHGDLRCLLEHLRDRGAVELHVHPYFDDRQLYEYLRSIDVALLPYRFGTHSGWLEACRDLGTAVVAPSCGCFADQGPVAVYELDEVAGLEPGSLLAAIRRAVEGVERGSVRPLGVKARDEQRRRIAAAHRRLYERVLAPRAPLPALAPSG